MASHEATDQHDRVNQRLASLGVEGEFQPDVIRARMRLTERERRATMRARRLWVALSAACVAILVLPWPRAVAQQVWNRLTLARVEVVQVTGGDLPESITSALAMEPRDFEQQRVVDLAEAERLTGFRAALPPEGVLEGSPEFLVVQTVTLATRPLRTADIERALAAAGASDVNVPKEWEGTTLVAEAGPVLVARYDGVELMQAAPFRMSIPSGFEFGRFMEMSFRVFGRTATEAKMLGRKLEANPALILHFPEREPVRDVPLRSGQGTIVGDPDSDDGICFFWNTADRVFIVSAGRMSQEQAVTLANSIR